MIPIVRQPLPAALSATLADKTTQIATSATPQQQARSSWSGSGSTRRQLKTRLTTMCARPAFCMYCHESRGTDVDHFEPIASRPLRTFDRANHMTLSMTGEFIDLTVRGAETIEVLGLNKRSELVRARYMSWRGIIRVFEQVAQRRRPLDVDDLEELRFLPVIDALHHFAHDVGVDRLTRKAVSPRIAAFAARNLAVLSGIFPACRL